MHYTPVPSTLSAGLSSRAVLAAPCTRSVSVSVNLALEVYADVHIPNYNQDCAVLSHSRIKIGD